MARGIDRQDIFFTDADREDLLCRLAESVSADDLGIYAWALMPNHLHLLVRTGAGGLSAAMRRLLTGYAVHFNREHRRAGHLFQNRYKSVLVEQDPYMLELVRYVHLNPLRSGTVGSLGELDLYPWTGHSALLGNADRPWQPVDFLLARFGKTAGKARTHYREFVASGLSEGHRKDLQGGGLVRSAGGWERVKALRRGRERWAADERVLGSSEFVEAIWREAETLERKGARTPAAGSAACLDALVHRVAQHSGLTVAALTAGSRRGDVVAARAVVSYVATRVGGLGPTQVGRVLHVSRQSILRGVASGEQLIREKGWDPASLWG